MAAAARLGYPVALKTAQPGILHKTEARRRASRPRATKRRCARAWRDLAARLGPRVLVARMVPRGVELALGMVRDPQFGPVVTVGAGGVLIELLRRSARGARAVRRRIPRGACSTALRCARCSTAIAAAPAVDIDRLALAISRFSVLAAELADLVAEIDVNPLICGRRDRRRRRARRRRMNATPWT